MGQGLQVSEKLVNAVVGEAIEDVWPVPARLDHASKAEGAKVGAGILYGRCGQLREICNRPLRLTEQIEDFDALGGGDRVSYPRKLGIQCVLERAMAFR